jgi:hypothetical protein
MTIQRMDHVGVVIDDLEPKSPQPTNRSARRCTTRTSGRSTLGPAALGIEGRCRRSAGRQGFERPH